MQLAFFDDTVWFKGTSLRRSSRSTWLASAGCVGLHAVVARIVR